MINRRELIKSSIFFGLGAASSGLSLYYLKDDSKSQSDPLSGSIWTLGEGGAGFTTADRQSMLTVLNLSSSDITQKPIPLKFGHHVLSLDTERMLCVGYKARTLPILERKSLKVIGHLKTPSSELGFSGHGHVLNDTLYMPCLSLSSEYNKGGVQSYDLKDLKLKDFIETTYPYPHDVTSSKGDLFVSYNDIGLEDDQYEFDGLKTAILKFKVDHQTGKTTFDKEYPSKSKLTAYSHLDSDSLGNIYISTAQMISSLYDRETLRSHLEGQSLKQLSISSTEYRKNRFSLDSPIIKLNTQTDALHSIQLGLKKQRRPLSTQFNPHNEHIYVTCPHSNTIIDIPKNPNNARAISALQLGISGIQGLCCLNGGKQMAIGGIDRGIAIFDTETLKSRRVFDTALNISTHLTYASTP